MDAQLGRIYKAIKEKNGSWLITADHGNAEMMVDPVTGGPHTAHTTNPVPMIYVAEEASHYRLRTDGSLRDISPTLLASEAGRAEGDDGRGFADSDCELSAFKIEKARPIAASPFSRFEAGLTRAAGTGWRRGGALDEPGTL